MKDIICGFNEKGELEILPDYAIELYFETESEMTVFMEFMESGELQEAFKAWKRKCHEPLP